MRPLPAKRKGSIGVVGNRTIDRISVGIVENPPAEVKVVSPQRLGEIRIKRNVGGCLQVILVPKDRVVIAISIGQNAVHLGYIFEVGHRRWRYVESEDGAGLRTPENAVCIAVLKAAKRQLEVPQKRGREGVGHVLRSGLVVSLGVIAIGLIVP